MSRGIVLAVVLAIKTPFIMARANRMMIPNKEKTKFNPVTKP
ncbi:hypothetical protein [Desertivirga arenae]|nr:hypothetical protein [Pedobacter sp. SYSU D00823]